MILSNNSRYQTFVTVSVNLRRKVPVADEVLSSRKQEIFSTISFHRNCLEFEFQTDRNYYIDLKPTYLALELKLVKVCCSKNYITKEVKKEHKAVSKESPGVQKNEEDMNSPTLLVTHVHNIFESLSPRFKYTSTIRTTPKGCLRSISRLATTSREPSLNTK